MPMHPRLVAPQNGVCALQLKEILSGLPSKGILVTGYQITARGSEGGTVSSGVKSGPSVSTGWVDAGIFPASWTVSSTDPVVFTGLVRWRPF